MQSPKNKALNHIINFTDKNFSSNQDLRVMPCELRALDHSLT